MSTDKLFNTSSPPLRLRGLENKSYEERRTSENPTSYSGHDCLLSTRTPHFTCPVPGRRGRGERVKED